MRQLVIMFYSLSWQEFHLAVANLAEKIKNSDSEFDCFVALARGGLTISHILSDFIKKPIFSFTVSTYKDMNQFQKPEIISHVSDAIKGKKVLLIDDIADSGDTLFFGENYIKSREVLSVETATLFYKPKSHCQPDYYVIKTMDWIIFPFEIQESVNFYKKIKDTDPETAVLLLKELEKLNIHPEIIEIINKT